MLSDHTLRQRSPATYALDRLRQLQAEVGNVVREGGGQPSLIDAKWLLVQLAQLEASLAADTTTPPDLSTSMYALRTVDAGDLPPSFMEKLAAGEAESEVWREHSAISSPEPMSVVHCGSLELEWAEGDVAVVMIMGIAVDGSPADGGLALERILTALAVITKQIDVDPKVAAAAACSFCREGQVRPLRTRDRLN